MQCPVDQNLLQLTDRQGVEIDYWPECRWVRLDRGEVDKIIDRSVDVVPSRSAAPAQQDDERRHHDRDNRRYHVQGSYKQKG